MIARTIFWKRFKKLFFGCFAIFFGFITCCLLGSWTYNPNTDTIISDNLWNNANSVDGQYIDYSNGSIGYASTFCYEYIECNSNITYSFNGTNEASLHIAFFNGNSYLSGLLSNGSFTTPLNCNRFSVSIPIAEKNTFMINIGNVALPYEPYGQIYINQTEYNELFYQYTDLQLDYRILQNQYNNVMEHLENYQSVYQDNGLDFLSRNLLNLTDFSFKDNVSLNDYYLYLETSGNTTSDFKLSLGDLTTINSWLKTGITASGFVISTFTKDDNNYLINFILSGSQFNSEISYNLSSLPNGTYTLKFFLDYTINKYTLSQIMLNSGDIALPYFPYGDVYNQFEYNNLYQDYLSNLDASFDVGQYTLSVATQSSYQNQWSFTNETALTNTDYIDSLGYLDVSSIYNTYIDGNINAILVHLENPVNVYNYDLMFNNFNLGDNINLLIKLNVNGTEVTNLYSLVSTNVNANETYTLSNFIKYRDSSIGILTNYTYQDFAIVWTNSGNSLSNVKLNGQGDYNLGFVNGLAQNNKDFVDLQNDYNDLSTNYDTLEARYDALEDQYNSLASRNLEFSMRNLVWYIASTPFESFKSIWSVDFLGLNIASFFTGLFSVFIIVWILKKIF